MKRRSAPLFVLAQQPNPFKIHNGGLLATAGEPLNLKWTPTTDGTISLVLRSGASNDLEKGVTLVSGYQNSGEYTWTPSSSLPRGSDYTVEIVSDSDPSQTNYTPPFVLDTSTVVASTTASTAAGATASTSSTQYHAMKATSKTAEETNTATTFPSPFASASTADATGTPATGGSAAGTTGDVQTGASFQATSPTGAGASSTPGAASQGSAAKATAMAGMLGVIALGALAL